MYKLPKFLYNLKGVANSCAFCFKIMKKKTTAKKENQAESLAHKFEKLAESYFKKYPHIDEVKSEREKAQALENIRLGILPTMSGLCYALGLQDSKEFDSYSNKKGFSSLFQRLRLRLLRYWEASLSTGKGTSGVQSWLSVNACEYSKTKEQTAIKAPQINIVVVGKDGTKQALSDFSQSPNVIDVQALPVEQKKISAN